MLSKKIKPPTTYQSAANIACTPLRIVSASLPPGPATTITGSRFAGT